jgi:hypothetical protein
MDKINLTKSYIIEGILLKKNRKVSIIEDSNLNKYNNMLTDANGNMADEQTINDEISDLIITLQDQGLVSYDLGINAQEDIAKYCKVWYARNRVMPSSEELLAYIKNRDQSFSTGVLG